MKEFQSAYRSMFAAPTNHLQKIEFIMTNVYCSDITFERTPEFKHRYLPFKTVNLNESCVCLRVQANCLEQTINVCTGY